MENKHFKYTPITHKEAFEIRGYNLITKGIGEERVFFDPLDSNGDHAIKIFSVNQWFKMEPCRIVDIAEAFRVLLRGGKVQHEEIDGEVFMAGCAIQYKFEGKSGICSASVKPTSKLIEGWIVLDEGTEGK